MPSSDQGSTKDRYCLIPRTLIFLTRNERVLLIKGASDKRLWAGLYNGVGGHIEEGEDVLSAARRELAEETGLRDADLWLCGTITIDTGTSPGIAIFVLRGECSQGEPMPSTEGELEWIPFEEINRLHLVEDLPLLLPKILGMRRGDPPFAAHYAYDEDDQLVISFG
jgi:8-oxo-dGTP diphosphatase